jgi:hypothetical protein
MKIHKFEIVIFDFEDHGIEDYKTILQEHRYLTAKILSSDTAEIGKWDDDHILNKTTTKSEVFMKYFGD